MSDSRAVATVDWDQDGDLDLWVSNRTAPRVRFLENNHSIHTGPNAFLAVRLQGTKSNRDAIGARVELETKLDGKTQTSLQTLRAGAGYLSQSSKWLHFGLGGAEVVRLTVRWPSGDQQQFDQIQSNSHYKIIEGGTAQPHPVQRRNLLGDVAEPLVAETSANRRVVPHRRLPIPSLDLVDSTGLRQPLENTGNLQALTLWASWCQPCMVELQHLNEQQNQLQAKQIDWLPINVEDFDSSAADPLHKARLSKARTVLEKLKIETPWYLATSSSIECLDSVQKVLTSKQDEIPLPCTFLLDREGKLLCVYKGSVEASQLIADAKSLSAVNFEDPRDAAIPLQGTWGTNPFPPDLMAIPSQLISISRWSEAVDYLVANVSPENPTPPITKEQLFETYMTVGRELAKSRQLEGASKALLQATKVQPENLAAHLGLADLYSAQGRTQDAVNQHRRVLKMAPDQPMSLNNLAWILATSENYAFRDPKEALSLAKRLCERTEYREPVSLDTYAVALAANGQFVEAVKTIKTAIRLAKESNKPTDRMEARQKLFESRQTYVETK